METDESLNAASHCLWGCAVGDALGLPYENLPPKRVAALLEGKSLRHRFALGHGMVSDDTEHSLAVARSLSAFPDDLTGFEKRLAKELRHWLFGLPAGIGFATLRSLLKLSLGVQPSKSGVFSAGNGPAMRSAIIGCLVSDDSDLRRQFVERSSRITHTDPKATTGALAVAEIAACLSRGEWKERPPISEIQHLLREVSDDTEWLEKVDAIPGFKNAKGISGYVYETVPFAISCWYTNFGDFSATMEQSIRGGGDTDSTTAICGALAGITCRERMPEHFRERLILWPVKRGDLDLVATKRPSLLAVWLRNFCFFLVVVVHCIRRCFPPYGS